MYRLLADGALDHLAYLTVEKTVMPMTVSPDKRWLIVATRAKPCKAFTFQIANAELRWLGNGPLAESCPYITFDRSGRWLLSASYHAGLVSVNPVGADGVVGEPMQVVPTARNAHAIQTDRTNHYVFVPHLGTDQVFQFRFDAKSGRLEPNSPPWVQLKAGSGPRHLVVSKDNRFVYVLCELTATVSALAHKDGMLTEVSSVSALPPESRLRPGTARLPDAPPRDRSSDIWASDVHLTPDERFLYAAERTLSMIHCLRVEGGKLAHVGSTPTEKQPRGFAIDPGGRYMVVSGEQSSTLSSYAIEGGGSLRLVGRYAGGKGANWVEIVA
ncbi:MAG TPA: beta-propeller fold lactonase family protein [Burkholderiales bacterium]|nr:beta-propeller fold lactonase family protein [Burkholderiales bacterium]